VDIMVGFEPEVRIGLIKFQSLAEEPAVLAGRSRPRYETRIYAA
jgi:hypothetical protein